LLKLKKISFYIIVLFVVLGTGTLFAAPPPPPAGQPPCWPPPCIPIDGGISALITVGIAYGAKKLYDKKKRNNSIS